MVGANTIVRKIHESIPGITIEEDDHFIKMIAQVCTWCCLHSLWSSVCSGMP